MKNKENIILESWKANAQNWIDTISNNELTSRVLTTNNAIINCVINYAKSPILDVGCGEGWLTRALIDKGFKTTGIDATEALVSYANEQKKGTFLTVSYQQLIQNNAGIGVQYNTAVINFALIDKEITEQLITALKKYIIINGTLIIQTLHPLMANNNEPYQSGWRLGSWDGLKRNFTNPYKWYFRTLEHWVVLFSKNGWKIVAIEEPLNPKTQLPASIIFVLQNC